MKLTLLSLTPFVAGFASTILAQTIPAGISSGCSTFLTSVDSDSALNTCVSSIVTATTAFSNSSSGSSAVDSAVSSLCQSTSSCDASHVRSLLTQMDSSCTNDYASNSQVQAFYDDLYALIPFQNAICATNPATNAKCADGISTWASGSSSSKRDLQNAVDGKGFASQGVPFLYLQSSLSSDKLCTPCTKSILSSYVSWEKALPYAYGIGQSPFLGGQSTLFSAVNSQCGSSFLQVGSSNVGTGPAGALGNGAAELRAPVSLLLAFATGFALFL